MRHEINYLFKTNDIITTMPQKRIVFSELEVAQESLYLQTTLLDDGASGLKLLLTDGKEVWNGQVTESDLKKLSQRKKMEYDKFVTQTVSALTRERLQEVSYEYELNPLSHDGRQLVWKKCISDDDIKFELGQVKLEKQTAPSLALCGMLSHCVTHISSLKKQIGDLETDNERLARDRTNAIKRLEKCVDAKEKLEFDLFSKFVAILNCKKEKIRELEEEIDQIEGSCQKIDSKDTDLGAAPGPSGNGNAGRGIKNSRTATPYDVDTDEEDEQIPSKQPRLAMEDSVILEEEEEDKEDLPAVVRRARRKSPLQKPSLSKPVLPKVTSTPPIERLSSEGRRSSLHKSESGSSKSSDLIDELLDGL